MEVSGGMSIDKSWINLPQNSTLPYTTPWRKPASQPLVDRWWCVVASARFSRNPTSERRCISWRERERERAADRGRWVQVCSASSNQKWRGLWSNHTHAHTNTPRHSLTGYWSRHYEFKSDAIIVIVCTESKYRSKAGILTFLTISGSYSSIMHISSDWLLIKTWRVRIWWNESILNRFILWTSRRQT